jgi:ubiquinone/menaquinone biosynthesis C-methylase UbiE
MGEVMRKWEREDGVEFLKRVGIRTGYRVLDFGARVGHYSIPAALVVGGGGMVYALDKQQQELDELRRKTERLNLNNIELVLTNDVVKLDLKDESIDVVLLYDVLHYLDKEERYHLYRETHHVLRANGFVSVYPKHVIEDSPLDNFKDMHLDDVKMEIQGCNFEFRDKYCGPISHDDFINQGCVFNFVKLRRYPPLAKDET